MRELFTPRWLRATIMFSVTTMASMVVVYGLSTWLPAIMRSAGFPLGGALWFLLALNLGAIVGVVTLSRLADRIGVQKVTAAGFVIAAASVVTRDVPAGMLAVGSPAKVVREVVPQ